MATSFLFRWSIGEQPMPLQGGRGQGYFKMMKQVKERMICPGGESIILSLCQRLYGIIWVGRAGRGKTVIMSILSMLWSLYHIEEDGLQEELKPSFRSASSFDSFRGEDGTRKRPSQYDDGKFEREGPEKGKAYCDVTSEDASLEQRWEFAKFEQYSQRQIGANRYVAAAEHEETDDPAKLVEYASHETFLAMLSITFSKDYSEEDVMAIFKRSGIVLFTENWVYYRQ
jgi:hypothetical protein